MNFTLYSIFDTKSRVFLSPFVARSVIDCTRMLRASKSDPQFAATPCGMYPQEFELYSIGTFDDETALIINPKPMFVDRLDTILMDSPKNPPAGTVLS